MDGVPGTQVAEVARLRACLNDLVSVIALPALWPGGEPDRIASTVADALMGMLRLTVAFVRLNDPEDGSPADAVRFADAVGGTPLARRIRKTIHASLPAPLAASMPLGDGDLYVASAPLGLQGAIGIVIVGSRRPDFPLQSERVLLEVAANEAAVGLQQAHLLADQKRVARDLDERVARRTIELATANEQLRREMAERSRAEAALAASERNLQLIIDTMPALAWSAATDGGAEFFNRHYREFSGLSTDEARGWGWLAAVHPDDLEGVTAAWKRIVESGRAGEAEARLSRRDGEYRWFLIRANPLRDEAGTLVKWYGVNTDIEDRKRAEAGLRRAYDSFAEAQRLSKTGSFIADLVADGHEWSDEAYRIFEFARGTRITMQRVRDVVHPGDLPGFESMFKRGAGGRNVDFAFRIRTARGAVKHVRGVAHVLEQVEGRPMLVGALQDVTETKVAEEALNRARADLAHISRVMSLGTLTASMAHEINQPLSGIITNASTCLRMLSADPPDVDGARETAKRTIRDGNRASVVIERLRGLYTGKEFTLESLDLNETVREVIALSLSELQRNRVVLQSEFADDIPPVAGARVQLQQVIMNLLRNASDAMDGVDDRARRLLVKTEVADGEGVRVTVRDNGVGIGQESMGKLFDAFYTTKPAGMGIGLSISRAIIETHRGRLWATPNPDHGATFAFSIPGGSPAPLSGKGSPAGQPIPRYDSRSAAGGR